MRFLEGQPKKGILNLTQQLGKEVKRRRELREKPLEEAITSAAVSLIPIIETEGYIQYREDQKYPDSGTLTSKVILASPINEQKYIVGLELYLSPNVLNARLTAQDLIDLSQHSRGRKRELNVGKSVVVSRNANTIVREKNLERKGYSRQRVKPDEPHPLNKKILTKVATMSPQETIAFLKELMASRFDAEATEGLSGPQENSTNGFWSREKPGEIRKILVNARFIKQDSPLSSLI